jgi:RNA polymerase subunit RPABC4/transcription elongation factor Spt4
MVQHVQMRPRLRYLAKGIDRSTGQPAERLEEAFDRDEAMALASRSMVVKFIAIDTVHREKVFSPGDGPVVQCPVCGITDTTLRCKKTGAGLATFAGMASGDIPLALYGLWQSSGRYLKCKHCRELIGDDDPICGLKLWPHRRYTRWVGPAVFVVGLLTLCITALCTTGLSFPGLIFLLLIFALAVMTFGAKRRGES